MKSIVMMAALAPMAVLASEQGLYGDTPDAKHAWSVHDWNRPKPTKVEVAPNGIPSDAIVLFDGTKASFDANWCNEIQEDGTVLPAKWKCENGCFTVGTGWKCGVVRTKRSFGDCQLHIEYRHPADTTSIGGNPQMRGNSGVFLMSNYEVQVLESYYTSKEMEGKSGYVDNYTDGQAGSVYAENPPMVNPQRKPGEWQVYDIVFHQPVWENGALVHPGSITVFFNGVLVQDHWELEGLTTHCRRRPLAEHATKGPLMLQDHGCPVSYRNVWIREIPSRWANTTHSALSGKEGDVLALRRATAAKLFAKIADPTAATAANVAALGEVISYAYEGEYKKAFDAALEAYRAKKGDAKEVQNLNGRLFVLVRNGVIDPSRLIW